MKSKNEYLHKMNLPERLCLLKSGERGVLSYSEISNSLTVSGEGSVLKLIPTDEEDLEIKERATIRKIDMSKISTILTFIFLI